MRRAWVRRPARWPCADKQGLHRPGPGPLLIGRARRVVTLFGRAVAVGGPVFVARPFALRRSMANSRTLSDDRSYRRPGHLVRGPGLGDLNPQSGKLSACGHLTPIGRVRSLSRRHRVAVLELMSGSLQRKLRPLELRRRRPSSLRPDSSEGGHPTSFVCHSRTSGVLRGNSRTDTHASCQASRRGREGGLTASIPASSKIGRLPWPDECGVH